MKQIIKPAVVLFITAIITIASLSLVYSLTEEPIRLNKLRVRETAMREVLPLAGVFIEIDADLTESMQAVFEGRQNGQIIGYVITLSPEGYSGTIDMLVGIDTLGQIVSGMRVVRHTETPGLGSLAANERFYRKFDDRPLVPLNVVKSSPGEHEIDAITSATITTKAITGAVNEAMNWVLENTKLTGAKP